MRTSYTCIWWPDIDSWRYRGQIWVCFVQWITREQSEDMYWSILFAFSCSTLFISIRYYIVLSLICCRQLYSSTLAAGVGLDHPNYWDRGSALPPPGPPPPPAHQGYGPSMHSYARDLTAGSRPIVGSHPRPSSGNSYKRGGSRRHVFSTSDAESEIFEPASSEMTTVASVHQGDNEDPDRIPPSGSPAKKSKALCTTLAQTSLDSSDLVV